MDDELKEVHEARIRALVAGDLETLDRCVAEDLTYKSPHGRVLGKQDVLNFNTLIKVKHNGKNHIMPKEKICTHMVKDCIEEDAKWE